MLSRLLPLEQWRAAWWRLWADRQDGATEIKVRPEESSVITENTDLIYEHDRTSKGSFGASTGQSSDGE